MVVILHLVPMIQGQLMALINSNDTQTWFNDFQIFDGFKIYLPQPLQSHAQIPSFD